MGSQSRVKGVLCFAIALVAHGAIFASWKFQDPFGARDIGEEGVDVGIGLRSPPPPEPLPQEVNEPPPKPVEPTVVLPPQPVEQRFEPQRTEVVLELEVPQVVQPTIDFSRKIDINALREDLANNLSQQVGFGAGSSPTYGGNPNERISYVARVSARLNRFKSYPEASRNAGQEGTVVLSLTINRDGTVRAVGIGNSAGFDPLDEAALEMVNRAQPFPAFPVRLTEPYLRFSIPVSFTIETRTGS